MNAFHIVLAAIAALVVTASTDTSAQTGERPAETLAIAPGVDVRVSPLWKRSPISYSNAVELIAVRPMAVGAAPQEDVPQARLLISTERRTSNADAARRLGEIARERTADVRFVEIGSWPAVEIRFAEEMQRRGQVRDGSPPQFIQRALVAIAAGASVVRFDASLIPGADPAFLNDAIAIARSSTFKDKGNPAAVKETLRRLSSATRKVSSAVDQLDKQISLKAGIDAANGASVRVQGGVGELEVATSADANNIVIASNGGLSFSTNLGGMFTAGNPGVFGLNDPSVSRAASGNFYLAIIAFPNGTAAQGSQTGCTNAVTQSTDSGANFNLQGFSALCPQSGAGLCFPDQEHIAADAINAATGSNDQIYAVWRNFVPAGTPPATCRGISSGFPTASISCSQDNGVTWTARAAIVGAGDFPRVAVGRDGAVYAITISGSSLLLNRFTSCANGLTADAGFPVTVATLTAAVACPVPGLDRCNDGNTLSSPTVAPDPGNQNRVFVSFAESDGASGERIVVVESTDRGATFPRRATVSGSTSARRFMPWSCSTRGNAYVGWFDRRAALAAGATNDLTDYFLGQAAPSTSALTSGFVRNVSNNPDPQCASGWPCAPRSQQDSDSCSVQPQLAGVCGLPAGGGSGARCDFSVGGCAPGEICFAGGGCPKYGDYNGIACAGDYAIAAWSSATPPAGVTAPAGLAVFASAQYVGTPFFDLCRRRPELCSRPVSFDRDLIRIKCKFLPCIIIDPIPRNCLVKWDCPGCPPGGLCPPFYHVVFDDTIRPWEVGVIDKQGRDVPHQLRQMQGRTVLSVRPRGEGEAAGSFSDLSLVFRADKGIRIGKVYDIRAKLLVSESATPKLE